MARGSDDPLGDLIAGLQQPLALPARPVAKPDRALRNKREEIIWSLNNGKLVLPPGEKAWFLQRARHENIETHRAYLEWVYREYHVEQMFWARSRKKGL